MDEREAVSRLVEFAMTMMDRNGVRPPALLEAVEVGSRLAEELGQGSRPAPPPTTPPPVAPPSSAAAESRVGSDERWRTRAVLLSSSPNDRRRTVSPSPTTETARAAAIRNVAARHAARHN
jgi:hypothetical protein